MNRYPKLIAWWCGTDALKLIAYPPGKKLWHCKIFLHRIFWRIFHRIFIHWAKSYQIQDALHKFGIESVVKLNENIKILYYRDLYKNLFNILFYHPKSNNQEYKNWLYGYDLFEILKEELKDYSDKICFTIVRGKDNMNDVWPKVDFYVRLNRWDGDPRMIIDCKNNEIPYYHGTNVFGAINLIKKEYEKKFNRNKKI